MKQLQEQAQTHSVKTASGKCRQSENNSVVRTVNASCSSESRHGNDFAKYGRAFSPLLRRYRPHRNIIGGGQR
jgi:hypothetical protein